MRADRDLLLAWDLLPKMDIATMSHGVEARGPPFLDAELAAFASAIPASRSRRPVHHEAGPARPGAPTPAARGRQGAEAWFRGAARPLVGGPLRPLLEDTLLAPDAHIRQFAEPSTISGLVTGDDELVGTRRHLVWALLARVVPARVAGGGDC